MDAAKIMAITFLVCLAILAIQIAAFYAGKTIEKDGRGNFLACSITAIAGTAAVITSLTSLCSLIAYALGAYK